MHFQPHSFFRHLPGVLVALLVTGCVNEVRPPATGPDAYSFGGTSISFTPRIHFINATDISYTNTDVTSPFPAVYTGKPGTYTYVPDAGFTSGTLTLLVGQDPIIVQLSRFIRDDVDVTGFTVHYQGKTLPATVTGSLFAFEPGPADGAASHAGLVAASSQIPLSLQGPHELTFLNAQEGQKIPGSRYDTGDKLVFDLGARTLRVGAKPLNDPQTPAHHLSDYVFRDGNLWYQVSGDRPPVEIAVYGGANPTQPGTVFYGTFSFIVRAAHNATAGSYFGAVTLNREGLGGRGPRIPNIPKGDRFKFTLSSDRMKLFLPSLDGKPPRTVPLDAEKSSKTNLYYSDQASSPANYVTINIALEGEGKGTPAGLIARYVETMPDQTVYSTNYIIGPLTRQ